MKTKTPDFRDLLWNFPYYEIILLTSSVSILGEPRWPLHVSFNNPLALILLWRFLSCVQHHSLYGGSFKGPPFLSPYLLSDFCCFLAYFLIAIATKDMFLLQVTTFRAHVYIVLENKEKLINNRQHNTQSPAGALKCWHCSFLRRFMLCEVIDYLVQP